MKSKRHRSPRVDTRKCIRRTYAPCEIVRVRNEEAARLVRGGMAVYITKKQYRGRVEALVAEDQKLGLS
jgi:hypothetical protein